MVAAGAVGGQVKKTIKCIPGYVSRQDFCYDIKLEDNLEQIWAINPALYQETLDYVSAQQLAYDGTTVYDMCQTDSWMKDAYIQKWLPYMLGFSYVADGLEMCNPLGLKSGKHTLHLGHAILLNLNPVSRFQLDNLMLVNVCKEKLFKAVGAHLVVSGSVDEDAATGTSYGASIRRFWAGQLLCNPHGLPQLWHGKQTSFMGDLPEVSLLAGALPLSPSPHLSPSPRGPVSKVD